jgi:deoxyxylulose-5-phosphate synthase
MVHEARKVLDQLRDHGMTATLVDLYSLPFDARAIASLAEEHAGRVLTLEDNYGAGFGAAVAGALAAHGGAFKVTQMCVQRIPKSGRKPEDVLRLVGLSSEDIVQAASELCGAVHV